MKDKLLQMIADLRKDYRGIDPSGSGRMNRNAAEEAVHRVANILELMVREWQQKDPDPQEVDQSVEIKPIIE